MRTMTRRRESLLGTATALACIWVGLAPRVSGQQGTAAGPGAPAGRALAAPLASDRPSANADRRRDGFRQSVKVFGERDWSITLIDTRNGNVLFHHGGHLHFDGANYSDTVEYANLTIAR